MDKEIVSQYLYDQYTREYSGVKEWGKPPYKEWLEQKLFEQQMKVLKSDSLPCVSDDIPKPLDWVYSKLNVKKGSTFKSPDISIRVCASWIAEYVNKYYR